VSHPLGLSHKQLLLAAQNSLTNCRCLASYPARGGAVPLSPESLPLTLGNVDA
jgi:hypothetical protein